MPGRKALQDTASWKDKLRKSEDYKENTATHLSVHEMFPLDPELQPHGGDVEGCDVQPGQVGGGGGRVPTLKTKVCHFLMV